MLSESIWWELLPYWGLPLRVGTTEKMILTLAPRSLMFRCPVPPSKTVVRQPHNRPGTMTKPSVTFPGSSHYSLPGICALLESSTVLTAEAARAKGQGRTELQIQVLTGVLGTSRSLSSAKPVLKITLVYSPEAKVTKLNLMK